MKSIFYAILAIILTCIIVGIYSFNNINGYIKQIMENKLIDIAISVSTFVSSEKELFELQPGDEHTETYQQCLKKLREIQSITDIKYIYIIKKDESNNDVFLIDADDEELNMIGLEYISDDEEYRKIAFGGQHILTEPVYYEEFGTLVMGYAPIKDNSGNIIAILGVDYSIDELNGSIDQAFRIYLIICVIIVSVVVLAFILLNNIEYMGMKKSLTENISEIKNISTEVTNSSKGLQKGNVTLSENTNSSLLAVSEMSATMDQTLSMVKLNNANTKKATEYFNESTIELKRSTEKMQELDSSILSIKLSSNEIQKIIEVMHNITKKTKILALNAEVEAARVGENGRGFSVVAKEVGDLAISSQEAGKNINDIINNNIVLTEQAVRNSNSVNDSLEAVNKRINDFSLIINEMSTASEEQEKGLHQLTVATTMIEKTVTSNADLADEINVSASTLTNMTDDLNHHISNIEKITNTNIT